MKAPKKIEHLPSVTDMEEILSAYCYSVKHKKILEIVKDFLAEKTSNNKRILVELTIKQWRELNKILYQIKSNIS